MRAISFMFVALVAIWLGSGSRGTSEVVTVPGDDFLVQVWDVDNGLPYSTVTSIAQTPDGFLWVGTLHGGLARFDGVRFVTFHPGNTPSMTSMEVQRLQVDAEGTLWVGMVEGALLSRRDGRFRFERASTLTPDSWLGDVVAVRSNEVVLSSLFGWIFRGRRLGESNRWETLRPAESILYAGTCEDRDGVIWYRRAEGKLGQVRGEKVTLVEELPGLQDPAVRALACDAEGRVWVGTSKEVAVWDGGRFINMTPTNGPATIGVQQLACGPGGELWVRTDQGFRQCVGREWRVIAEPVSLGQRLDFRPMSLHPDGKGGVWLVRYGEGLWYLDAEGRLAHIGREQGLPNDLIEAFYQDREGNVWVGPAGAGLVSVRRRTFYLLHAGGPGSEATVHSVAEDREGAIWLGTAGNRLLRVRDGQVIPLELPIERAAAQATIAYPDVQGRVWIGSVQNGVWLWESNALRRPIPLDAVGTVARVFLQERRGRLWIGNEFGLYLWQEGLLKHFDETDGFAPAFVMSLAEDTEGHLWMGTGRGELRRFGDGQFTAFRPPDVEDAREGRGSAPAETPGGTRGRGALTGAEQFWALLPDGDGVLWIGTLGGGLLRFQEGRFVRYTPRQGLPNEHVSQILDDREGHLWLGTRGGIARVRKSALERIARGEAEAAPFASYGRFDGLPSLECSGGMQPACWRGSDGRLWFSTVKGAVWVQPNRVPFNPLPPPVVIEGFWVDNELLHAPELLPGMGTAGAPARPGLAPPRFRIAAGRHFFEMKFTALSFTAPDKVRFRWRLEGDRPLAGTGAERSVNFSHLPAGSYEFHVTACNNDGVWNESGARLGFVVLPHFWQTWWFRTLAVLGLGGMLAVAYSLRIARLRALERLRLRIARDLHDEVGANLGSISLLAQVMEHHPSAEDAREVRLVAAQTVDTLRDIVWFIDPAHERLSDLVNRLAETAKTMLHGIEYEFKQTGDFHASPLPLDFRRNVLPIFKEALHNAIKHAGAPRLSVQVRRWDDWFQVTVEDNGRGFAPEQARSGNGLKNMRRRAAEMKAELDIRSRPGGGTTVTLTARIP